MQMSSITPPPPLEDGGGASQRAANRDRHVSPWRPMRRGVARLSLAPPSTDNQNCARYTRVEITQNACRLKGAKLLMQHAEFMPQRPAAAFWGDVN